MAVGAVGEEGEPAGRVGEGLTYEACKRVSPSAVYI